MAAHTSFRLNLECALTDEQRSALQHWASDSLFQDFLLEESNPGKPVIRFITREHQTTKDAHGVLDRNFKRWGIYLSPCKQGSSLSPVSSLFEVHLGDVALTDDHRRQLQKWSRSHLFYEFELNETQPESIKILFATREPRSIQEVQSVVATNFRRWGMSLQYKYKRGAIRALNEEEYATACQQKQRQPVINAAEPVARATRALLCCARVSDNCRDSVGSRLMTYVFRVSSSPNFFSGFR